MKNEQVQKFLTGNEAVAAAAKDIKFDFMGYYPITPSTEISELIQGMRANGEVDTVLLPADGEHGAAGACFGAAAAGARVLNATSANGLLYSIEQLPAQAGCRLPMVLNLVTRSVSAPLDIRCDHSDLMFALQTHWIVLLAAHPQAVYDLNIIAVKLGEHPDVRLPVMVVSDGFFTSHQRQSIKVFNDSKQVQNFLGARKDPFTVLDPRNPVTIGPYMNDPDLVNNKFQLHQAHQKALEIYEQISRQYEQISGRYYPTVEAYQMEDATAAVFLLNSAAETAKDPVDTFRSQGKKIGMIRPNILRPFPFEDLRRLTHRLSALVVGERADTPGATGGPLSHEVHSVLLADRHCGIQVVSRIYGLGGKDFTQKDAVRLIEEALLLETNPSSVPSFGFMGTQEGEKGKLPPRVLQPISKEEASYILTKIVEHPSEGEIPAWCEAFAADPGQLTIRPKRIAPGHGACPGCGIFSGLDQFFKGIEGDVVVLYHTGCAMVVTTDYPFSAHRVSYLHNLFQNGAPTLSGVVEVFYEKKRRGEIDISEDITFIMITGDGGMDIGMGPTLGAAIRNHRMIVLEYDNQGYMNTGGQLSYSTPYGHKTATSQIGQMTQGHGFHHRDTPQLMAAIGIPYVFTAIESPSSTDLVEKAAKAQWYSKKHGFVFGKILVSCPLNWKSEEKDGFKILQKAADCCFFPLYDVQHGKTRISYDPDQLGKRLPVSEWLKLMGKSKHLLLPENEMLLKELEREIDTRWKRLKAKSEHRFL